MDPLMRELQAQGFDIEWHIIVLNELPGEERYSALAAATGGTFLSTGHNPFDPESPEAKRFMNALRTGSEIGDGSREQRQRQYEIEASKGQTTQFDWYKALPPK